MTNRRTGRPTLFSPELADEICRRLAEGTPFSTICRDEGMPAFSTLWRWEKAHPEFRAQVQEALETGTHFIASECLRIADDIEMDVPNRKLMIDTRIRLIGKWNRRGYGDKLEIDHRRELESMSDEELQEQIKLRMTEMRDQGIDIRALLPDPA